MKSSRISLARLLFSGRRIDYTESLYMNFNVYSQGHCTNTAKSVHCTGAVTALHAHSAHRCLGKRECDRYKTDKEAVMHHYRLSENIVFVDCSVVTFSSDIDKLQGILSVTWVQ